MKFPGAPHVAPGINFDKFVRACVFVRHLTDGESLALHSRHKRASADCCLCACAAFQRADVQRSGYVTMGKDQFLDLALSAP